MNPVIIDAYSQISRKHHCGADRIVINPQIRNEFLAACHRSLGETATEEKILGRLLSLRKNSKLPTSS